jgi:hypothetical protein
MGSCLRGGVYILSTLKYNLLEVLFHPIQRSPAQREYGVLILQQIVGFNCCSLREILVS